MESNNQNSKRRDWSSYNSQQDLQDFIDREEIKNFTELNRKFGGIYSRIKTHDPNFDPGNLIYPEKLHKDWSSLQTIQDIKNFMKERSLTSLSQLRKKFPGLYGKLKIMGLKASDFGIEPQNNWSDFHTLEDFQTYLDKIGIKKLSVFKRLHRGRDRFLELGLNYDDLIFEEPTKKQKDWSYYDTKEKIQTYIDEHGIQTPAQFGKEHVGLYLRSKKLGFIASEDFNFPKKLRSRLEIDVEEFLVKNNINFEKQKRFENLLDLRCDFYLPDHNIVLEPGGEQHHVPVKGWGGQEKFEKIKERDKRKYDFCITNNIIILYYFRFGYKSVYKVLEETGYMGEWYTDFDKFTERILDLTIKKRKENKTPSFIFFYQIFLE